MFRTSAVFYRFLLWFVEILSFVQNQGQQGAEEVCGIGWKRYQNSCYKIYMARLNWTEARDACHSIGARLMKMDTKNEGEFVGSHFLKLLSLRKLVKKPWCGLSGPNEGSVAAFRWLDHTAPAFNGWVHYNKTKGWPYRGKCVVMKGLKRGSWFTTDCAHQHPYICKKEILLDHPTEIVTSTLDEADFSLSSHVMESFIVQDVGECSLRCFRDPACLSFNYEYAGSQGQSNCELNNSTRALSQSFFVKRPGFVYYE